MRNLLALSGGVTELALTKGNQRRSVLSDREYDPAASSPLPLCIAARSQSALRHRTGRDYHDRVDLSRFCQKNKRFCNETKRVKNQTSSKKPFTKLQ